mmetsp:Transcript_29341/g.42851  ORF Transcript_29341/g.42851 Transcript_29341/m.42851 type:complete len:107 (+) Transcript_29341:392-712(+)
MPDNPFANLYIQKKEMQIKTCLLLPKTTVTIHLQTLSICHTHLSTPPPFKNDNEFSKKIPFNNHTHTPNKQKWQKKHTNNTPTRNIKSLVLFPCFIITHKMDGSIT